MCVPEAPIDDGTVLGIHSQLSYYGSFGKELISGTSQTELVTISVPSVTVTQTCTPILADAQDKITCTVLVSSAANLV